MGRLSSKVALVTGAASGIGAACARAFVEHGATVLLTDISAQAGEALAAQLGDTARFASLDVTKRDQWTATIEWLDSTHGRLDVLVHNAGGGVVADIETCTLNQWRRVQALNVESVFMGTQAALPLMSTSSKAGSIINISSIAGIIGEPDLPAYGAAKAAVRVLSKTIALHCTRKGYPIRCNSVHPGFIDTPMVSDMAERYPDPARAHQRLASVAPIGRLGTPQEVANLVVYLASDESSFVTGAEMVIDGGTTSR